MKVTDLLLDRQANWQQLELLSIELEGRSRKKIGARKLARFATLYRGACADLALADSYQLPPATVRYLHELVGRAHNQLYRSQRFNLSAWWKELFHEVPRRLFHDNSLRLAFAIFWGSFFAAMFLSSSASPFPGFASLMIGEDMQEQFQRMYSNPIGSNGWQGSVSPASAGGYILHNTSIGLRCFAMGLLFGIGGLFSTLFNGLFLGAVFGFMSTTSESENFYHFVTAHGPFELTAIVLSAAAGMRLGFSIVDTKGLTRRASLQKAAHQTMPTMGIAMVLFFLAAFIEGFISPSPLPYEFKAFVAMLSTLLLLWYFVIQGYSTQAKPIEKKISAESLWETITETN